MGLSATQRPMDEIGRFVSGGRPIELVDAGRAKELDLRVVVPVEDMREPGEGSSIWPSIYPAVLELVQAAPLDHPLRQQPPPRRTPRSSPQRARRARDRAGAPWLARARAARRGRGAAQEGRDPRARRHLVARARHRHGRGRPRHPGRVAEVGRSRPAADRPRRAPARRAVEGTHLSQVPRRPPRVGCRRPADARGLDRGDEDRRRTRSTSSRSRSLRSLRQEEISVDELHDLVRRAYPFRDLSRQQLENVLDMLAGPLSVRGVLGAAPADHLGPGARVLRGREGARRLAVTNAGTIPDRGLFGVYLVEGGGRVGELDEEMVYEARAGQTFLLGASTWRIEEITRDRVLVSPAPGIPATRSLLEGGGRSAGRTSSARRSAARRASSWPSTTRSARMRLERGARARRARGREPARLPPRAGSRDRRTPSDRTIVVERFRDEIGDWRLCVLTPFGGRVHAPWSLALAARLRESLGLEVNSIWSDDGIALHLPGRRRSAAARRRPHRPERARRARRRRARRDSALRRTLPRERGPRAPHPQAPAGAADAALAAAPQGAGAAPGRAPLRGLPGRARDLPRVPPGRLRPACAQAACSPRCGSGASTSSRWRRPAPRRTRPRSSSTTSRRTCTRTTPRSPSGGRRRSRSTATCSRSSSGQEELRDLIDPRALEQVEAELRGEPRSPTSSMTCSCGAATFGRVSYDEALAADLEEERRAVRVRIGGEERLIAAEDAGRYRDALGAMPPRGLPDAYLEGGDDPLGWILRRYARGRGSVHDARRWPRGTGLDSRAPRPALRALGLVRGELRPGGTEREWSDPDVLRRLRRASLAALAQGGRAGRAGRPRALPARVAGSRPARDACARRSCRCRGSRCRSRSGKRTCSPAACPGLPARAARPADRVRRGRLGRRRARAGGALLPRGRPGPRAARGAAAPEGRRARAGPRGAAGRRPLLVRPPARDRSRGRDRPAGPLGSRLGRRGDERRLAAPAGGAAATRRPRPDRRAPVGSRASARTPSPRTQGRWSSTPGSSRATPIRERWPSSCSSATASSRATAFGPRAFPAGTPRYTGSSAAWRSSAPAAAATSSRASAARSSRSPVQSSASGTASTTTGLVLAAADPAQPYGAALPWPKRAGLGRPVLRAPTSSCSGEPALFVERGGRSLVPLRDPEMSGCVVRSRRSSRTCRS